MKCDVCGKPIKSGDEHYPHDTDCPNYGKFVVDGWQNVDCECDNVTHEECCYECKEAEETK